MKNKNIKKLSLAAMFLALGIILPFFTGQIPQIGSALLPMHIPVFLCAFICGYKYATPIAFILPLFRTFVFGVPNFYPESISIAFELAVYAFTSGLIYEKLNKKNIVSIYKSLVISMILGRVARIVIQLSLLGIAETPFTLGTLLTGIVIRGIPGIVLQMIIIPLIISIYSTTQKTYEEISNNDTKKRHKEKNF